MPSNKFTFGSVIAFFQVVLGIFSAGLGLKGFLVPNNFIDGGVTGTSMLTSEVTHAPLWVLLLVINLPFVIIGFRQIGVSFAVKSALAIAGLAAAIGFLTFPVATGDKLLAAVFGGFFLGAGIGLAMRGGAVLDGTEIVALIVSRKIGVTVGDVILSINILIFSCATVLLGLEPALYSILTYFSASRTIDFLLHGIEEYNGMMIVSDHSDAIRKALLDDLGRGVTIYKGRGGKTEIDRDILFCVVTRLELPRARRLVRELDREAFVVVQQISDTSGGVVKKRVFH